MGVPGAARGLARGLRVVALVWAILFTGAATLFAGGYALTDPGWPVGFLLVAAWLIPLAILILLELSAEEVSWRVLWACVALSLAITSFQLAWPRTIHEWEFAQGPVVAIASFVPLVPLALLGRRRPLPAALMIAIIAFGPMLAQVREGATHFGSSAAVSLPMLIAAALLLVAGLLERDPRGTRRPG